MTVILAGRARHCCAELGFTTKTQYIIDLPFEMIFGTNRLEEISLLGIQLLQTEVLAAERSTKLEPAKLFLHINTSALLDSAVVTIIVGRL